MSVREEILARVRANQPAPAPLPVVPVFAAPADAQPPLQAFQAALERMGGRWAEAPAEGDLGAWLATLFPQAKVVVSATGEVAGTRPLDFAQPPAALEDVDVGVVRALFGVAETGSVLLDEIQFGVPALGFLSQHLVVLLDPQRIVADMHAAYLEPALARARYAVFMTGPSATADIEGVLIRGAQGIRSLTVVPLSLR
ncbi:MAG: LUD domain-containing protein [Rubrivivax sp.]|nr:LUD domain-containing protein [Rubrivivax sp.]